MGFSPLRKICGHIVSLSKGGGPGELSYLELIAGFHTGFLAWEGKLFVHQQSVGLGAFLPQKIKM